MQTLMAQSEFEDSFQLASDWIKSVQKSVNKSNSGTQREYSSKPHSIVKRILVFKQ